MTCFNKDAPLINEADDKVLITAFKAWGEFPFSIYRNNPKTMAEVLYKATKHMNVEDAMIARGDTLRKRKRQDDHCLDRGRKPAWTNDWRDDKRSRPPSGRMINFTSLNTLLDQVLMQIRDDAALTWPNKLKSGLNKRSARNKYYHFHGDHGHDTSECYNLKQQIETLIKQRKLQRFVKNGENSLRDPMLEKHSLYLIQNIRSRKIISLLHLQSITCTMKILEFKNKRAYLGVMKFKTND